LVTDAGRAILKHTYDLSDTLSDRWIENPRSSHSRWSKRGPSAKRYICFRVDGTHVQARFEDAAQRPLVIIGATPEGKKEERRRDRSASALRIRPGMGKSS
jgi:hypothetical protein